MKQKDLAQMLGVTKEYLSAIRHGHRSPSLKLLKKVKELFGFNNLDEAYNFLKSKYKLDTVNQQ